MNHIIDEDIESAVSELKEVIKRQKDKINQLHSIIDQVPGCVYWKDKKGIYLGHNQFSADNLYGHEIERSPEKQTIIGKSDFDIYSTDVAKQFRRHDAEVIENNSVMYKEELLELENGETFIQLSTKQPFRNNEGHVIGVIGNTVNISYLKKIEKELRRAKEISDTQGQKIKDDFMCHMEHDIRTPLNGIIGVAEHLIRTEADDDRKELLSDIRLCAKELMNYCNSILDFTRIEKGTSPEISKKFSLRELVERIVQIERPAANNKKLDLILEWPEELPDVVIGDDYRLYRILVNLVSNAIKFTNDGSVKEIAVSLYKNTNLPLIDTLNR